MGLLKAFSILSGVEVGYLLLRFLDFSGYFSYLRFFIMSLKVFKPNNLKPI